MKILTTPEERFQNLPDYPFEPHYVEIADGLRMHYVDQGPRDSEPILMLHGEPSWSYLYRFMIPPCAEQRRVIAPDLIGFGKSSKPAAVSDYSYQLHLDWMVAFIERLDLRRITLFCQDWGALIGLRLAAEQEHRFARIVVGNGSLPSGDQALPGAFKIWRAFALYSPWFPIGRILNLGSRRQLSSAERRAYDAPFPSKAYKAGARAFPALVPTSPDNPASTANRRAWNYLGNWRKPFLTTFSSGDPINRGVDKILQRHIPGAQQRDHLRVRGGHFLQEDSPTQLAQAILQLIEETA